MQQHQKHFGLTSDLMWAKVSVSKMNVKERLEKINKEQMVSHLMQKTWVPRNVDWCNVYKDLSMIVTKETMLRG